MRYTHRVMVRQAIHIHGWATGKHEHRGTLELHRAWQVKTHGSQTRMRAHSGATEMGSQQSKPAPSQTVCTLTRNVRSPSFTCTCTDREAHSQTTDTHWDPTTGPLRAQVADEDGEGPSWGTGPWPAGARVTTAAGPAHRCTSAWPHLGRGLSSGPDHLDRLPRPAQSIWGNRGRILTRRGSNPPPRGGRVCV